MTIATTLEEACAAMADTPEAALLAGGTDLMVEVNHGHRSLTDVVTLDRIPELDGWERHGDSLRLRAGLTYAAMADFDLAQLVPGLAQAARTVGSPQIRNTGTLGGNLATASPAGDTIPVLAALDAIVELRSEHNRREVPIADFITGVKRNDLRPGELIEAVRVPVADGPQEFLKVDTRNAMVISVVSLAMVVDRANRQVKVGLGAAAPVPRRAVDAERFLGDLIDWDGDSLPESETVNQFGKLVMAAASPIDDHRGSASYRQHAIGVLARRALLRCFGEVSR